MADVLSTITGGHFPFTFRTNPNSINWTYNLNTTTTNTYGGRVIQILSVNLDNLAINVDSGNGGNDYLNNVVVFFRNLIIQQRDYPDSKIVFSYPNRGYRLGVVPFNITKQDSLTNVLKTMTLNFKIQEDITGILKSNIMDGALSRLASGIGYEENQYNYQGAPPPIPTYSSSSSVPGNPSSTTNLPPVTGGGAFTDGTEKMPVTGVSVNSAIAYANAQASTYPNSGPWHDQCATWVASCYGTSYGYDYANQHPIDGTDRNPPVGAILIWDTGNVAGHVTLYTGSGYSAGTDLSPTNISGQDGQIGIFPANWIETKWNGKLLGWAYPVF